jgi:hypothetical protein
MDTSICSHLRELVERRRATPPIKTENGAAPAREQVPSALERRYTEVVRWGALDQGIKRRKVCVVPSCFR